jgi:hypothetical protein
VDLRSNGRGCGGPRCEPGAQVHGGPHRRGTPRFDKNRPRKIQRPRSCACEGRRRACRKQKWRGGASPEDRRRTLDRPTRHQIVRERALHVDGKQAHAHRGSKEWLVHPRRPVPKGGGAGFAGVRASVLRCAKMTSLPARKKLRWRGSVTTAVRAALRRDRGASPENAEGVNLRQGKLSGCRCNFREKERERWLSSSLAT